MENLLWVSLICWRLLDTIASSWGRTKIDTCLIGLNWLKMPCVKMPHEMCFLAHRGVWFERVKVEKYPIRLNSLLNYHISNHIWQHVRSKMISKSNILIIIAENIPEQLYDQIVLFQPLFLNLIHKHFFRVLSTPPGPFQELSELPSSAKVDHL